MSSILTIAGIIQPGYQVASGRAANSPYPSGSIALQRPFFRALGLDLSDCFAGTLNVNIAPSTFKLGTTDYTFRQVTWLESTPPEDFSFVRLQVIAQGQSVPGWLYYPHPDTKPAHIQNDSTIEVLAPWLEGVGYGETVELQISSTSIMIEASR